jgi:D-3-phosphoglycerate dehydrogenase
MPGCSLRAVTADGSHEFAGTVLRDEPYVVQADGYWVDFMPTRPATADLSS